MLGRPFPLNIFIAMIGVAKSEGYLSSSPYLSLLRNLLAELQDRVNIVDQEVTLDVNDLGGIDERANSW